MVRGSVILIVSNRCATSPKQGAQDQGDKKDTKTERYMG